MPWKSVKELEREEELVLDARAVFSCRSAGRKVAEHPHPYRMAFQRDRARIVHCAAFRRLDGKTQVFLNGTGDHFRTRLTHTMEVASVARTIARALGLNEDLAEAIALAHDLGHPPFGHAGEEELHRLMQGHGGFDHNVQSLRVVELLEERSPELPGLNLSHEVLEGLRKHEKVYFLPDGTRHPSCCLEGQLADLADEIAYSTHDVEDGLESGLLDAKSLGALELWEDAVALARQGQGSEAAEAPALHGVVLRSLMNLLVDDLVRTSATTMDASGCKDVGEVRMHPEKIIQFSRGMQKKMRELKSLLYREFYFHPSVESVHRQRCQILRNAFTSVVENPALLGRKAHQRIGQEGLERTVCDYLAGMTDRYLIGGFGGD